MLAPRTTALLGACNAALAIGLGAFAAHALRDKLSSRDLAVFETASRYHLVHAVALLAIAAFANTIAGSGQIAAKKLLSGAAIAITLGITLFSGSLYVLATTSMRWLGPVTPIGGVAFIAGWLAVAGAMIRLRREL